MLCIGMNDWNERQMNEFVAMWVPVVIEGLGPIVSILTPKIIAGLNSRPFGHFLKKRLSSTINVFVKVHEGLTNKLLF